MLDQETRDHSTTTTATGANRWLIGATVILALGLIATAAWAFAESSEADDLASDVERAEATTSSLEVDLADARAALAEADATIIALEAQLTERPSLVVVGDRPPTARQEAMVAMVTGPWADAWNGAQAEAVAAMFTPNGVMYDIEGGETLTIEDGTIERFAARWAGLTHLDGLLVHGDKVIAVVELAGREVGAVIDFTERGDLLIEWNAVYDSELGPRN
jgi:hypothetical protein